jgi:hypothetical protein
MPQDGRQEEEEKREEQKPHVKQEKKSKGRGGRKRLAKSEPKVEAKVEPEEEPEEGPEVELGEGVEDWSVEELEEEPEDFHLPHPDEVIAPIKSRKRSATNVSTPPPARTRQRHVLTEEDKQRMARHR